MEVNYAYKGNTAVIDRGDRTQMSFSPDTKREPTFFIGELRQNIAFREAISALHDVVVSDLRFKPKDKTAYKEWAAKQMQIDWQLVAVQKQEVASRMKQLQEELKELNNNSYQRLKPYYDARDKFRNYVFQKQLDLYFLFDPVITVHPDEIFFECFSVDESSYGRLGASYEVFKNIDEFACGTTNIDYSHDLYNEFQKIRSYKTTKLEVDPSGFEVQTTNEEAFKEVKIDLPDSWVRGFLQVSSAMSLPATRFDLHPMDIHNMCLVLRRHKEKQGPRSMRYHLKPGEPVRVIFEPWNIEVVCPRSPYTGTSEQVIRVWGRRRLLILERLIAVAKKFTVHLLGTGMPSFYVADLGDMSFTLGLSGWTANDWSRSGNFDLMTSRTEVDNLTKLSIFEMLKRDWLQTPDSIANRLNVDRSVVLSALSAYTQAGRAIFDLNKQVYRVRELSREPLPMDKLRFANEREEKASRFLSQNAVRVTSCTGDPSNVLILQGNVKDKEKTYTPSLTIDSDSRIINAECTCNWHFQNKLFKGPCEHILALRTQHLRQSR
ncbi:SWIM zinc finger family protein [Planktothrix sp. FACHB-1355]|uniref:SWIM zinc finger family protein n=1 Tax=Aerosakkonema funiforme FACHB-1375 TaxID=2949571 RepID=A0A926VFG8_9CYAN|nr:MULTISPECIES: SWIM zinc finger family protein [Oscillatoriales]MBD2182743.1 SWIM zinc finger family protein [Aerosakkonema funiforme FACHB-1375]MBD3558622.1 SWIM zinc finger family protein [Planktothrix sp. FACHB-1355]